MPHAFWKFSTAGNTTLFLEHPVSLINAMRVIAAEQGGYADLTNCHLEMAGGELCINAAIAFAALADMTGSPCSTLKMANQSISCQATGRAPRWFAWIDFNLDYSADKMQTIDTDRITVSHLPGISHVLIECTKLPEPAEAIVKAQSHLEEQGLGDSAAGVVWWRRFRGELELTPVVAVPEAGTFNLEGACGSASLAVALIQSQRKSRIRQPSGEYLTVEIGPRSARIEAPVSLLASGELWQQTASIYEGQAKPF